MKIARYVSSEKNKGLNDFGFYSRVLPALAALALTQNAYAACALDQVNRPETVYIDLSNVQLKTDVAVGGVIATKAVTLRQSLTTQGCSSAEIAQSQLQSSLIFTGASSLGGDIYNSPVDGIGFRLSQRNQSALEYFPFKYDLKADRPVTGEQLVFELVKTSEKIGTGQLMTGEIAQLTLQHAGKRKPLYNLILNAGNALQHRSCTIEHESVHQEIQLGTLRKEQLKTVGDTALERQFKIGLSCPESPQGVPQVQLGFRYTPSNVEGVVANGQKANATQGVGVQLLQAKNHQPIANGAKVTVDDQNQQGTQRQLSLIARYYKTEAEITPGAYYSTVTFKIDYP